jgi:beta,beta-carotene 9',10'-dioxygenase
VNPQGPLEGTRALGFQSMEEEIWVDALPLTGELPAWLRGRLVRLTPALFEVAGRSVGHWFDGLAMLNVFTLGGESISYGSRFLETAAWRAARGGKVGYVGFGNRPDHPLAMRLKALLSSTVNDNCNVKVAPAGDVCMALTDLPVPVRFDPETLETLGPIRWRDRVGGMFSGSHFHSDERGALINYVTHIAPALGRPRVLYRIFETRPGSARRAQIAEIEPGNELAYIHSFALTERFIVLVEFPLLLDPLRFALERPQPFAHHLRWRPERGTRIFAVDRSTRRPTAVWEHEPIFALHHVNAFERDGELVLDLIAHEDGPAETLHLEVERLRDPGYRPEPSTRLRRLTLPLGGGEVGDERLDDAQIELPRINYRDHNTRPYRYLYAATHRGPESDWYDGLLKLDLDGGETHEWWEEGCYPGEPLFVPGPPGGEEDAGVVLATVLDSRAGRSFLLVLDARELRELARAALPHHLPLNFHMDFFGAT